MVSMAIDTGDTLAGSYRYLEGVLDTSPRTIDAVEAITPERVSGAPGIYPVELRVHLELSILSASVLGEISESYRWSPSSRPVLPPRRAIIALDTLDALGDDYRNLQLSSL